MLNTRIIKAWQDLVSNKSRTLLVLLALILGTWGIGSVLVSYSILSNDLTANYLGTNPADIAIVTQPLSATERNSLHSVSAITEMELRPLIMGRIEIRANEWVPLYLWVVQDFAHIKISRFYKESGAWPPPQGSMLIERDGLFFTNLKQGDALRIRLPGQAPIHTSISGITYDPGMAQSRMDHLIYGYITADTLASWYPAYPKQRWLFTVANDSMGTNDSQQIAEALERTLDTFGKSTKEIYLPPGKEHPHQFQLNSLLFLQGGIGILAFLLSGVLVINLINVLLANQIRQIGIMKAIGASSLQIMTNYLGTMLILGMIATAIAVPLSVISGYGFARFVSGQLNFNILTHQLSGYVYLLLIAGGLLLPLLAAFIPVVKAVRVSVNEALGSYGINSSLKLPGWLSRVKLSLPLSFKMAILNSLRRRYRFYMIVCTLALGLAIFMAALNVRSSLVQSLNTVERTNQQDVLIMMNRLYPKTELHQWLTQFSDSGALEFRSYAQGRLTQKNQQLSSSYTFRIVPADSQTFVPVLLEGQWLNAEQASGIVVNQKFIEENSATQVGDTYQVNINDHLMDVQLIGIVKEFAPAVVYLNETWFNHHLHQDDKANVILIKQQQRTRESQQQLISAIEKSVADSNWDVRLIVGTKEILKIILDHLDIIAFMLAAMGFLVLFIGGLGLVSTMSVSVMERSRELGVLRAIGATPSYVRSTLTFEGIFMVGLAWCLGYLIAIPISREVSDFFGRLILKYPLDYKGSLTGVVLSLGIALMIAILASRIPAKQAVSQSIREVLTYE